VRHAPGVVLLLPAVFALAACGHTDLRYSPTATASCLQERHAYRVVSISREDADDIARAATEAGYAVDFGKKSVSVVFVTDGADGAGAPSSYGVLSRKGNAVIFWDSTPTDRERDEIESCLREAP
jgi:hypothetical protein